MKKKPNNAHTCGECKFSKGWPGPELNHWNLSPDGEPITLHCHKDPQNIKRGLFPTDPACPDFEKR